MYLRLPSQLQNLIKYTPSGGDFLFHLLIDFGNQSFHLENLMSQQNTLCAGDWSDLPLEYQSRLQIKRNHYISSYTWEFQLMVVIH